MDNENDGIGAASAYYSITRTSQYSGFEPFDELKAA
jgi:hypothetical protein